MQVDEFPLGTPPNLHRGHRRSIHRMRSASAEEVSITSRGNMLSERYACLRINRVPRVTKDERSWRPRGFAAGHTIH